jgi:opacity protein-like surface antigen
MKNLKIFTVCIACFLSLTATNAQTSRGKIALSIGSGLEFGSTMFQIMPTVSYFFIDNLSVGISGTFSNTSMSSSDVDKTELNMDLILSNISYVLPLNGKIKPYLKVGVGRLSAVSTSVYISSYWDDVYSSKNISTGTMYQFGGGISFYVLNNVSFNLWASYLIVAMTENDDTTNAIDITHLNTDVSLSIYF